MSGWRGLRRRLRWRGGPREEAEAEIRFHLEELAADLERAGLSPPEARTEAARRFGPVAERRRELERSIEARRTRARRGFAVPVWAEAVRSAGRSLVRRPLAAAAAISCLGFGIAAVATVATLVDELVLRAPGGIATPGELRVVDAEPRLPGPVAAALVAAAERATPRLPLARHLTGSLFAARGVEAPERVLALGVDGAYFPTLGVRPASGRLLGPADDAPGAATAVVSASLARRQLGGTRAALGRTLRVEGRPFTVVGVVAPAFGGTFHGFPVDLWLPFAATATIDPTVDLESPERDQVELILRLPPGVDDREAAARLDAAVAGLRLEHPTLADLRIRVHPFTGLDPENRPFVVAFVGLLGGASLGLLAIAASPVGLWLLARGRERRRELAVRAALGARRTHLVGLLAAEGALVGLLGGLVGVVLAAPLPRLALELLPPLPVTIAFAADPRPARWVVILAIAAASGVLAGLPGALVLRARRLASGLRGARGGIGSAGAGRLLVGAQVALTAALLVTAGALVGAVRAELRATPGFDLDRVAVLQRLDVGTLRPDVDGRRSLYRELAESIRQVPGVEAAGAISRFPLSLFASPIADVSPPDRAPEGATDDPAARVLRADLATVDPAALDALGIALLRGRAFTSADGPDRPLVALVDRIFVERWFPGANDPVEAVGRQIRVGDRLHTIVGVVEPFATRSLLEPPRPTVLVALDQLPPARVDLVLRTARPAAELAPELARRLHELEPDLPAPLLQPGAEVAAGRLLPQRLAAGFTGLFGGAAFALAAFGLWALASWRVAAERREIGIRLGLGATPGSIRRLVVAGALRPAALGGVVGTGIGLLGVLAVTRVLPGVDRVDPVVLAGVGAGLVAAAALAAFGPAVRASRIDPSRLLRSDS